jgi:hypothetical protein
MCGQTDATKIQQSLFATLLNRLRTLGEPHNSNMRIAQNKLLQLTVYVIGINLSGFGGLEITCWPLVPKFAGSNPAEAVGFFSAKNPQHAFLGGEVKAVLSHVADFRH